MRRTTFPAVPLAILLACTVSLAGCTPGSTERSAAPGATVNAGAGDGSEAASRSVPPVFDLDRAAAASLAISADGGRASVPSGNWMAMVAVPAGAAPSGAAWSLIPLRVAPAGIPGALAPGVYVDEGGQPPTGDCLIAFRTAGKADPDATIFRLSEDGATAELVATDRRDGTWGTMLVAEVPGFSPAGVGKGSAAARDKAKKERRKQKLSHYTISVHDKVSFTVQDWKFTAVLDLNLAADGSTSAGNYKGRATLVFTGKYNKTFGGVVKGLGDITWKGNGKASAILYGDLAPLVPPDRKKLPYLMTDVSGEGSADLFGKGTFDAAALGPAGAAKTHRGTGKEKTVLPYLINVTGTKVTVEIANVGEFSGNLDKF